MRNLVSRLALAILALALPALGSESFNLIHVDDLDTMIRRHTANLFVYDANPSSTRAREGVIPGAHLLSTFRDYDVESELPSAKDAKLVFYCANAH